MELTWTTDKSVKAMAEFVFARGSGGMFTRKQVIVWGSLLLVTVLGLSECFCKLISILLASHVFLEPHVIAEKITNELVRFFAGLGTFIIGFLIVIFTTCRLVCRRAYRRRKAQLIEYHLTDDVFAFTSGVIKFSSPWNKIASHYRLAEDVLFLYDTRFRFNSLWSKLPFEAQCIPDWQCHGVERAELAATLEKAGLKKTFCERYGRKVVMRIVCVVAPVYVFGLALAGDMERVSLSKNVFQQHLGGVELNRAFFQIVDEGAKESDNPYFDYWEKYGNFVQRFAARRMSPLNFEKYEYFFKDGGNSQGRKIGIAGTVGDRVYYARMPSGEVVLYNREQWERYKSQQKPEGYYPPSARTEWLEKVRPLVPELRKAAQDRLLRETSPRIAH